MALGSRRARGVFRLACLAGLLALSFFAVAPPPPANACMSFGTYIYRNCQGQYLATCYVQTNCVSCCTGPITGWCTRSYTPGSPTCGFMPD